MIQEDLQQLNKPYIINHKLVREIYLLRQEEEKAIK